MKIVALSDLHGYLPDNVPPCDLLLIAGDVTPVEDHHPSFQADWLGHEFRSWLNRQPARKIVGVAGNHDFIFERASAMVPRDLPWTYLQDSGIEWEGLHIWGTPWQPWFFNWAFNAGPDQLRRQWALIPDNTDILVLHGPPHGYGDGVPEADGTVRRNGCPHLLERIVAIEPRLVVYGHIHEGRGEWQLGKTKLANVTIMDANYQPVYQPWRFELNVENQAKADADLTG